MESKGNNTTKKYLAIRIQIGGGKLETYLQLIKMFIKVIFRR